MEVKKGSFKDIFFKQLDEMNLKVTAIFNDVLEDHEFSSYKLALLEKESKEIEETINNMSDNLKTHNFKCERKYLWFIFFRYLLLLIGFVICVYNFPISLIFIILSSYCNFKSIDYRGGKFSDSELEDIDKQTIFIKNTLISCVNLIEKRRKDFSIDKRKKDLNTTLLANHLIETYFSTGEILNVDYLVTEEVIKILQRELLTTELNLDILLKRAKEKISMENKESVVLNRIKK